MHMNGVNAQSAESVSAQQQHSARPNTLTCTWCTFVLPKNLIVVFVHDIFLRFTITLSENMCDKTSVFLAQGSALFSIFIFTPLCLRKMASCAYTTHKELI